MGRSKKQLTDLEKLQQENKELREINKSLSRQLKKESKKYKPEHSSSKLVEQDFDDKDNYCPDCGKGKVIHTNIGPRVLEHCSNNCGYKKVKKNGKENKKDSEEKEVQPEESSD